MNAKKATEHNTETANFFLHILLILSKREIEKNFLQVESEVPVISVRLDY
jgi:hypothetical protein